MTVTPLASTPMIGRSADMPASATPGTGFGDLLSVLGAQPGTGGQDANALTVPFADRNAATLGDPFATTEAELPGVASEPADTSATNTTESAALATPLATGLVNGKGTLAEDVALPATSVDEAQIASVIDAKAPVAGDADKEAPASPVVTRPRAAPTPASQPAATADPVATLPAVSPADVQADASAAVDAAPTPNAGVGVANGAATPVMDATSSSSLAATGLRTRSSRQAGADALASNSSAAPMAEAIAGGEGAVPRGAAAGIRSPNQDDRGKAKSNDRATASNDQQALAPADATPMLLATPMTAPLGDQSRLADTSPAGSDQDNGQPTSSSTLSSAAPVSQSTGTPAQQPQPGQDNLPSLLASQTPAGPMTRAASVVQPYAAAPTLPSQAVIAAQPGRIGRDMGVEIARQVTAGRQEVLVRLDPAEMGRIDVRLSFDDKGHLHAAMSADSPAALDMLRRDAGDLGRALAGAGIQADPSTFRFDSRGGDAGQSAQHQQQGGQRDTSQDRDGGSRRGRDDNNLATMTGAYRQLRTSSRVDLTA